MIYQPTSNKSILAKSQYKTFDMLRSMYAQNIKDDVIKSVYIIDLETSIIYLDNKNLILNSSPLTKLNLPINKVKEFQKFLSQYGMRAKTINLIDDELIKIDYKKKLNMSHDTFFTFKATFDKEPIKLKMKDWKASEVIGALAGLLLKPSLNNLDDAEAKKNISKVTLISTGMLIKFPLLTTDSGVTTRSYCYNFYDALKNENYSVFQPIIKNEKTSSYLQYGGSIIIPHEHVAHFIGDICKCNKVFFDELYKPYPSEWKIKNWTKEAENSQKCFIL